MKINWRRKKIIIPTAILMITTVGTAAALVLLFTHNFPGVTIPGTGTLVVNLCTQPALTASAPGGATGGIIFSCGLSVNSAVFATTSVAPFVAVSPFSGGIPSAYQDLYAVPAVNATAQAACPTQSGSFLIVGSGTPPGTLLLQAGVSQISGLKRSTSYVYCADFSNTGVNPASVPSFAVSWEQ